jgi:hypothetical protein
MTTEEPETTVRALLGAAGLSLSDEQVARYVRIYPILREGADRLFIAEARYEEPAVVFRAAQ